VVGRLVEALAHRTLDRGALLVRPPEAGAGAATRIVCRLCRKEGTVIVMAWDGEYCCFCRRVAQVRAWTARPGWLEAECPTCGRFRVERQFLVAAHFIRARQPALYRRLAQRVAESQGRDEPLEIPFEGWETIAGPRAEP